jgi:signal transduction histidine kinase
MMSWRGRVIRFHLTMTLLVLAFVWLFLQSIKADTPHTAASRAIESARYNFMLDYRNSPPPASDPDWRPITLPHRVDTMGISQGGYSWYVFEVEVSPNSGIDSIYIPRVAANAEVFVNGKSAGFSGHLQGEATERNWNRPIAIMGMTELRTPGIHTVAIQVRMYTNYLSGISTIWVGPSPDIRSAWLSRMFNQIGMLIASTALMIGAAIVLLILSLLPPTRRPYLVWLILATVFWVVRSYSFMINATPFGYETWVRVAQFCLIAFFLIVFYLTIRFCDYPKRHLEKRVFRICLLGSPLLILAPGAHLFTLVGMFGAVGMVACLWGGWLLVQKGNRLQNLTIHGFAWGMGSLFLLSMNDLLLLGGILSFNWYFLNQYLGFLLFLALAYFMAYEYARMLRDAQNFNAHLQTKLGEQARHLQAKHETLQHTEMQKVQLAERQRLMADMHDGLGAHLVSAIHQLRNDAIPRHIILEMLQDGLRDLQLTIDSLEPIENDLSVLVGAFRYRISPSLNASNIKLNWKVAPSIPPLSQLNPQMGLMVLRILQEAFTNILKHSNATEVTFQLQQIGQNVELEIADNGIGFDVASTSEARGKGLGNMKHRANQIGATLEFASTPMVGTQVRLTLPVKP